MIFITGPHGAGKTTLGMGLPKDIFLTIDTGPILRSIWQETNPQISFQEFIQNGETIYGINFTDELLTDEINRLIDFRLKDRGFEHLVLLGSRSINGVNYLKRNIKKHFNRENSFIIYIDGDKSVLYRNYCIKQVDKISILKFQELLTLDKNMGLETIKSEADFVVNNTGTKDELIEQIAHIIMMFEFTYATK